MSEPVAPVTDRAAGILPSRAWATGTGSLPGTDPVAAVGAVLELLTEPHVPFLPELPERGVGADMIGRGAAVLVDMAVDLQPSGWRLVDRPGRDLARARSWWRQDVDVLAERAEGYVGPMIVTVAGPWTLAAGLQLPRGSAAAGDTGARRDIVDSLTAGVAGVLADVARAVPGARLVLQLDEPSLPAVVAGRLPTVSGFGRLPAVPARETRLGVEQVLGAARAAGAVTAVHCCAADAPIPLLAATAPDVLGIDVSGDVAAQTASVTRGGDPVDRARWEALAAAAEGGCRIAAGVLDPADVPDRPPADVGRAWSTALARLWREVGLPVGALDGLAVTPACGLVAAGDRAAAALRMCVATADAVAELVREES